MSSLLAHSHCQHLKSGALVRQRLHSAAWEVALPIGVNHLSHPEPKTLLTTCWAALTGMEDEQEGNLVHRNTLSSVLEHPGSNKEP